MPLFIRDDHVDALANRFQTLTGSRTKTEAVRMALEHEIRRQSEIMLPSQRIGKAVAMVEAIRTEAARDGHARRIGGHPNSDRADG